MNASGQLEDGITPAHGHAQQKRLLFLKSAQTSALCPKFSTKCDTPGFLEHIQGEKRDKPGKKPGQNREIPRGGFAVFPVFSRFFAGFFPVFPLDVCSLLYKLVKPRAFFRRGPASELFWQYQF